MRRYLLIDAFECIDEIPIAPMFFQRNHSQRFMVMSTLPTTETQKIQSVGFVTRQQGT